MKKILFIHRYGKEWECSIHLVEDGVADKALGLFRSRMWDMAYRLIAKNDLATQDQRLKADWNSLDAVDVILAHFRRGESH